MTIFDVIRYPISNPPTKEEFEALPADLYRNWLLAAGWASVPPPRLLSLAFQLSVSGDFIHSSDLEFLRKMIKEYDNI